MITTLQKIGLAAGLSLASLSGAQAEMAPDFLDKLDSEERPIEDRMRDDARRPYQVMELLGVEEGMTVLDVAAGGGWYTRVLSAAVGPDGTVIAHFGPRALQNNEGQAQKDLANDLGNVEPFFEDLDALEEESVDAAITALSMHHADQSFVQGIYDALKPGGQAVFIDHEGSPGNDNSSLHRMVAADARSMLEESGFEIVEESDLLHTNADDQSLEVRAPELARNTDRFLFVVRKPE